MLKFFHKWKKREDGTTAIEFSFLLMPYVLLTLGIIEISLMFTAESLLEGSVTQASRQVKTGQLQRSGAENLETEFRGAVCDAARVLINCDDVIIESRIMNSFTDFSTMQPQFDEDGNMVSQGFNVGGSSDRVLIRVGYRYNGLTPFVSTMLWGADGSRYFMSTVVLQTEPYDFETELANSGEI